MLLDKIREAISKIDELSKEKRIRVVSHFDTDGITSAAVFSRALSRWGKEFSLEIVKSLDEEFVRGLPEGDVLVFLDLASGSLDVLGERKGEVIVLDHHEIIHEVPKNVLMVNPVLEEGCESLSGSAICYLFARELNEENRDLANLGVIGMVGDLQEKNIGKLFDGIISDSETTIKKGLMLYPATRPLNMALEYSSNPYLPGVSGNREGVMNLLREAEIKYENGRYKSLCELSEDEMMKLITSIVLKAKGEVKEGELIGNLFLVKFFNKMEDARELSALINACSRMGSPEVALGFCLGNKSWRAEAEKVYITYKQNLVSALRYVEASKKIDEKDYMIINAKDNVQDTIIGTVCSIISHSPLYETGKIVVGMAYSDDGRIKVSSRLVGREGRNVRDLLNRVVVPLGGEVGGHPGAAGCVIGRDKEEEFIEELGKVLRIETVKV